MPTYKVIKQGFYNSMLYHPEGKRNVLHTAKPFTKKNPMPSWLTEMPKESEATRKKREAQEASQTDAENKKSKQDEKDIENASFLGDGEAGSSVETI